MKSTEQKFAVLSDLSGDYEGIANVKMPNTYMPASSGVFLQYGMTRTMPGSNTGAFVDAAGTKVQTPDGNPVIHQWRHISGAGIEYPFAFTKAHIYLWSEAGKAFTEMWECTADCELWDTVSIDGKIVATNGVDFVLVWDESDPGTDFAPLDTAGGLDLDGAASRLTTAKYCIVYEGYLILGAVTEDAVYYGKRERWCSYGDITDFDVNGNGDTYYKDFVKGSDSIKGFGIFKYGDGERLAVFKEKSIYVQWLVESLSVWNTARVAGNVGLMATHSVCNDKEGNCYYLASDFTIRQFPGGIISQPKAETLRGINLTYSDYIVSTFIDSYNQIWWSIPSSMASTGNDKIIALNLEYKTWHDYPFTICSFGDWQQQTSFTIDGLDEVSETIDGLDATLPSIDFVTGIVGYPLDLGSDYDGYVYVLHSSETDMGSEVTREFVMSVDMTGKQSLQYFKRVSRIKVYIAGRSSTGVIELYAKSDNSPGWESLGSIPLKNSRQYADVDLPVKLRAKHFLIKGTSAVLFDFVGIYFTFEFDGEF